MGKSSGRPTLRLEDLALCLKILGPGKRPQMIGCSLDLPDGALSRLQQRAQQIGAVSGMNNEAVSRDLSRAVGVQDVRLFGLPADTNAAFICIEADYILKRISQGKTRSPVKNVKSFMALMKANDSAYNRWWFVPNYESVAVAEDGLSFELRSRGLKVKCSASQSSDEQPSGPGAAKFAELVTENFSAMQEAIPSFADLSNLCDLAVLAALIRQENLDKKTHWDTGWVDSERGFPIAKRETPRTVESVAAYKRTGRSLSVAVGGVTLEADETVTRRTRDPKVIDFKRKAQRPTKSWKARVPSTTVASHP
jgi:hypothetical protein